MSNDRLIQLLAAVLIAVCLVASTLLMPVITRERHDLQIGFDTEIGEAVPPKYILAAAASGSFRGLFLNMLWYRAEMQKREGEFAEANSISRWITVLQPRFEQAWAYRAWDMAYNISVETKTPQERWNWVNNGVRLLREEGIPYNPMGIRLYRELSWIFIHKIGQYSDDMHWYYKAQLASEWQEVLGSPTDGATTEQVLAEFRPIAVAADRYFVMHRPTLAMAEAIERLREGLPEEYDADLDDLGVLNIVRLDRNVRELRERVRREEGPGQAQAFDPLIELIDAQQVVTGGDPLLTLYRDRPGVEPIVDRLRRNEVELNREGLRRVSRLAAILMLNDPRAINAAAEDPMQRREMARRLNLDDPALDLLLLLATPDREVQNDLRALRTFWRARVILEDYKMDPGVMYECMEQYGPMDWRHPASHGVYWSYLGVKRAQELVDTREIDLLNTERQIIQSVQELAFRGDVNFDWLAFLRADNASAQTAAYSLQPDPRFFKGYEHAMRTAFERWDPDDEGIDLNADGHLDTFENGHENLLVKAVQYSYLYGDTEQARAYYEELNRLYGNKRHNARDRRFQQPLADFVLLELRQDMDMQQVNIAFVDAMLERAFLRGLSEPTGPQGRTFNRFVQLARQAQDWYRQERGFNNPEAPRERLLYGDFPAFVVDSFARFIADASIPLDRRARAYHYAPPSVSAASYPAARGVLMAEAQRGGWELDRWFPPPADFDAEQWRQLVEAQAVPDAQDTTVERK